MEELKGVAVKSVEINNAKDLIVILSENGDKWYLSATGDCCSSSWFEHIEGIDALIGETINKVVDREMPEGRDDEEHEHLEFYGWTLETAKGRCDIEMRNASNGYYGGDV